MIVSFPMFALSDLTASKTSLTLNSTGSPKTSASAGLSPYTIPVPIPPTYSRSSLWNSF